MCDSVRVWMPLSRGTILSGFAVPWGGLAMTRQQYESLLQDRLQDLISQNLQQAQQVLTGSPEYNPNLYSIAMSSQPRDWPALIMKCDQMFSRLNQISYPGGQSQIIPRSEMPGLQELVEVN
jgi:hypothetical protein